MAVVFPQRGNPEWPLPPDYADLTAEGKRLARVNAVSLGGEPELDVASWRFLRNYYLVPESSNWYKDGYVESPESHSDWVREWYTYSRLVMACPRGFCKTTINLEDIMRQLLTRRNWECVLFLSTREFCSDRMGRVMNQLEENSLIIDDFGKLKPKKGRGLWNRGSTLETTTRCSLKARPIKGAALGTRPSGLIVVDDVEQDKDLVLNPADTREAFHQFFFNALHPMARNPMRSIPMRVVGTLYHFKMFIHWLATTDDERVAKFFKRIIMTVHDMNWSKFDAAWEESEKMAIGAAAFSAQYLNKPSTEEAALLKVHPELTTYHLLDRDEALLRDPLNSNAKLVTHQVTGFETTQPEGEDAKPVKVPVTQKLIRPFGPVARQMYRFLLCDYAGSTSEMSDFSAMQVLGLSSDSDHPNTIFSLDAWMGKENRPELVARMVEMAARWGVTVVGLEAYALQLETFERFHLDLTASLRAKFKDGITPAIIPIKFPTSLSKGEKIKGIAWRFDEHLIKIPSDRNDEPAYAALWYQIEHFTSDMKLLRNDDILDTLAMHQGIVKAGRPVAPIVATYSYDAVAALERGELLDESGHSNIEAVIACGRLTDKVVADIIEARAKSAFLEDEEEINYAFL